MGIFSRKIKNESLATSEYKMVTMTSEGFFSFNGTIYKSDIVRAAIRPAVTSVGKLIGKHIRKTIDEEGSTRTEVFPELYMKYLLEEPNPYMTGQDMQEKMAAQLLMNGNAFALIVRDPAGLPCALYPIPCQNVNAVTEGNRFFVQFTMGNGKQIKVGYDDLIHLRQDYGNNYFFGESSLTPLLPLMEAVTIVDQGLIKAIKNSGIVRWLLKFLTPQSPEDIKKNVKGFVDDYLSYETDTFGAAGIDAKVDAQQIAPNDYVPNSSSQEKIYTRIKNYFNTNDNIIQSKATESEWAAYYEQVIEPIALKLSNEYTRKLFSRRQRSFGNRIFFEGANLEHVTLDKKLALQAMVDRGAMTPNEWRDTMNLAPLEGGDTVVRRLDTAAVEESEDNQ